MNTRSLALIATAVLLTAIGASSAGLAQQQSFDGAYKGSLECRQMPEGIGPLRLPLAILVRNGRVMASASMRQRYCPAYFSTLAMLSLVTKPGPDEMWRGP